MCKARRCGPCNYYDCSIHDIVRYTNRVCLCFENVYLVIVI